MNDKLSNELIDEDELRAALGPLRPDRDAFETEIRRQIESKVHLRDGLNSDESKVEQSDWSRVAASVIPLPLLGKGTSGSLTMTLLAQLPLGQKIVAITALPAIGLMLMITATIWAFIRVRIAHREQRSGDIDILKLREATTRWWKQFGVLVVGLSTLLVLFMWLGYTLPVFVLFLVSGVAMVSLISRLGRDQMIDRRSIGATLCPGMFILAQLAQPFTMLSHGTPLLDQTLVQGVLMAGGLVCFLMCISVFARYRPLSTAAFMIGFTSLVVTVVGWFSTSLWNPVTTQDMKVFVESFDNAPFSSASWRYWRIPAAWLQDSGISLDLTSPRKLLKLELAQDKPNARILRYAFESDLIQPEDLSRLTELSDQKGRLFSESEQGRPFISLGDQELIMIHRLLMQDQLSDSELDFLAARLLATFEELESKPYGNRLEEQLAITKLTMLIGRPMDIDANRTLVHKSLVDYQRLNHRFVGMRRGGFASSAKLDFSDAYATADAIELMQIYGVPDNVDLMALRSYLRPTANDQWSRFLQQSCMRVASLQRLESLPDVTPIKWLDYLRNEQNLIMAILFVLLCIFATLGAPNRRLHTS